MADNLEILNTAVSLVVRAALLAARFSERVRQRSLRRLASRDVDTNAREILFLKDRVCQLEMQISILQKHLHKKGKKPRYEVRERLLILWHMGAFQMTCITVAGPRRQTAKQRPFRTTSSVTYSRRHDSPPIVSRTPRSFCCTTFTC
jgi:hypothetical protein